MPIFGIGGVTVVFLLCMGFLALVDLVPSSNPRPFVILSTVGYAAAAVLLTGVL